MTVWPEVRASFRLSTGRELAKANLDEFLEHTMWYMVNAGESAYQRREALTKALSGEAVDEGDEITIRKASSMLDQLDEFEEFRTTRSVE